MSYSVKNFIEKNCTNNYDLSDLKTLAKDLCKDSGHRYTHNNAIQILCRYASVKDGEIVFDANCRNIESTLDGIISQCPSSSETIETLLVPEPKPDPTIKVKAKTRTRKTNDAQNVIQRSAVASRTGVGGRSTFGSLGSLGSLSQLDVDDIDEKNTKTKTNTKTTKAKSITTKDTKMIGDKKTKPTEIKNTKTIATKNVKSAPTKTKTTTKNVITNIDKPTIETKTEIKKPTGKSGFGTLRSNKTVKKQDSEIETELSTNTIKPIKKGGFGKLSKNLSSTSNKDNGDGFDKKPQFFSSYNFKSKQYGQGGYSYPTEKKYPGLIRDDKKYGPYGTDSYYGDVTQDDKIMQEVKPRIDIFRYLSSIKYPKQRSSEWFILRDELISASDGGTVVGLNPHEQEFGFITKKVHGKPFKSSVDCYHGRKYEQVATMIYEYRMNVKVKEFGLCRHPKYKFLGASPDGIVSEFKLKTRDGRTWDEINAELELIEDPKDKQKYLEAFGFKTRFVGRMLEIKCPLRRKIILDENAPEVYGVHGEKITDLAKDVKRGVCPTYYWVQVQLQLQCCELDECDFWQSEIWEYPDKEDFLADTDKNHPWLSKQTGHEKGVVIQLLPIEHVNNRSLEYNDRIYEYSEFIYQPRLDMTPLEIDQWVLHTLANLKNTHKGKVFERILYWRVMVTRCTTIKRDDEWFEKNLHKFETMWNYVEYFRTNKDKSELLKKYINTFPVDAHDKVKEPPRNKGIIMKTINDIYTEPIKGALLKDKKSYEKIIANIKKHIEDSDIDRSINYDVENDIEYIRDAIGMKIPDDLEQTEKDRETAKFIEFIKRIKLDVEDYLFSNNDSRNGKKSGEDTLEIEMAV